MSNDIAASATSSIKICVFLLFPGMCSADVYDYAKTERVIHFLSWFFIVMFCASLNVIYLGINVIKIVSDCIFKDRIEYENLYYILYY